MIRNVFLTSTMIVTPFLMNAQEVNVKRGVITVDGTGVAKISKEKRVYKVSDLTGNFLFSVEGLNQTEAKNPVDKMFFRFIGANGNIQEVYPSNESFTFSMEKSITRNLVEGTTKFLTPQGIDHNLINQFFSNSDQSVSKNIDEKYEQIKKAHQEEDELAQNDKITIAGNGNILKGNERIGRIIEKEMDGGFFSYTVVDLKGTVIAKTEVLTPNRSELLGYEFTTFDGQKFVANEKRLFAQGSFAKMKDNKLTERIVKKLYKNGYTLGNMDEKIQAYQNQKQGEYNEAYKQLEANSLNLVEVKGYILTEKNAKIEGLISIPYENIEEKMKSNRGIEDLTNYGGILNLKDEAGKAKTYRAKDGILVVAGERKFIGARGTNDDATGNSSGSQLSILGESQFFEIDYENAAGYVVHHPKNPQYPYIKLKSDKEAFYLGSKGTFKEKSKDRLEKIFNSSLKCPQLNFVNYDVNTKEGLIKLLDDYASNNCKKK